MVNVAFGFLHRKGLTVTEYTRNIVMNNVPMDEFGILLLARMFHRHFAVVMRDYVWTTGVGITVEDCTIVFAFYGDLNFLDTCETGKSTGPSSLFPALKYSSPEQDEAVNLSAENDVLKDQNKTGQKDTDNSTEVNLDLNIDMALHLEDLHNTSSSGAKENVKTNRKPNRKPNRKRNKSSSASKENVKPNRKPSRKRKRSQSTSGERKSFTTKPPPKKPKRRNLRSSDPVKVTTTPRSSRNSAKQLFELSLDDVLSTKRKRSSAPTNLAEKDPLKEQLPDENLSDIENKSDHASEYETEVEEEEIKTEKGSLTVKQHGIKKRPKKDISVNCPVCSKTQNSQHKLNLHMKEVHPNFKFNCGECKKEYSHYNACYKHIVSVHYAPRHVCEVCNKGFAYPGRLTDHMKTHTGKGLLPCTYPKCKKKFTSNRSMFQHLQSHSDQQWKCNLCDPVKDFNTYSNYNQHVKGYHNPPSLKAPCGKVFKWQYQRTAHYKDCTECGTVRDARKNKAPHPRKLPIKKG